MADFENNNNEDLHCSSAMEVCYMQLEASWLIKQEVPIVCKRVKRILQRCIELLKPDNKSKLDGEHDISNIYFNVKNDQQPQQQEQQDSTGVSTSINQTTGTDFSSRRNSVDLLKDLNSNFVVSIEDLDDIFQDKVIENKPVVFETHEGTRGTLNLNGWLVESPEILIKFSKPMKQNVPVYKTLINKSHPWRVQQIQNSFNYLHLILTELDSLIVFAESYTPLDSYQINNHHSHFNSTTTAATAGAPTIIATPSSPPPSVTGSSSLNQSGWIPSSNRLSQHHSHNPSMINSFPELHSLVETFNRISEWLSMARDELILPSRNVFPSTMYQSTVLQPPLPFEINVNLTVSNCELVFSVYELHIASTGGSIPQQILDNNSPSKLLRRSKAQNISSTSLTSSVGINQVSRSASPDSTANVSSDPGIRVAPESEGTNSTHGIAPFQTTKGGSLQWVTVVDHTEYRQPIPTLVNTFTLLTNAYDRLADLGEKLLVLSNFN